VDEVIARQFGLDKARGALVNQVVPNSPASRAGLQRGDIIVEFGGKKVANVQELQDVVSGTPPNKTVKMSVLRDGKTIPMSLKTAVMPKNAEAQAGENEDEEGESDNGAVDAVDFLGAKAENLTERARADFGVRDPGVTGVIITDVPPDSDAAEAGLAEGDVVRSVNRQKTDNVRDLEKVEKAIDAKKGMVIDVVRRGRSFYLSFKSIQ
jgi:serine protease Do